MSVKKTLLAGLGLTALTTAVWAHPPDRAQMQRVKAAAHDLEGAVRHVHESAGRGHGRALDDLEKKVRRFHRQVEKYQGDPAQTEDDFAALADAYFHARDQVHHTDDHLRDDFRDVESHMHVLMDFYGGRDYWDQQRGRH